ncbi:MAG: hypothetical protein JXR77_15255 [Lentisphaeria bacterium]|nr:hypothetical protein [Lentisphaeria bacterium]
MSLGPVAGSPSSGFACRRGDTPRRVRLPHLVAGSLLGAAVCGVPGASGADRDPHACFHLPPSFAARVVFYHSFGHGLRTPEINRIGATVTGIEGAFANGLTGPGYRCATGKGEAPLVVSGTGLSPDRPISVMTWWRLDAPMRETTGFNVLTLHGKGLIGSFVRGKGEWCALPEPRRVFQVYYFPGIANRNDVASDRILFTDSSWRHTAITVAAASEICVYWDGELKTRYATRGRPFGPGDVTQLCPGPRHGGHPMTLDDIVVTDCVLAAEQVRTYVEAVRSLAEIGFPSEAPGDHDTPPPARK